MIKLLKGGIAMMRTLDLILCCVVLLLSLGQNLLVPVDAQCPDYPVDGGCKLWSDAATWPGNKIPENNDVVTVTSCVILDTNTARLGPVTIATGGSVIFTPDVSSSDVTLTAASVLVLGTFRIGSHKCRYEGKANVVLTGKPGENTNADFGSKFIGVGDGGTLELHGHKKLAWTKLNATLEKLTPANGLYFDSDDVWDSLLNWKNGFLVYVVEPKSGTVRYKKMLEIGGTHARRFAEDSEEIIKIMDSVPPNHLIMMASNRNPINPSNNLTGVFEAVEKAIYCNVGHSRLRHLKENQAYVMIALKEHPTRTVEVIGRDQNEDGSKTASASFSMPQTNTAVHIISKWHAQNSKQKVRIIGATYEAAVPRVAMANDVTTWVPGDRVVIASTDYDWTQATEGLVEKCPVDHRNVTCEPNQVRINYFHDYMHWGEITHQVDMRAEVGLLSRNIRIRGEVAKDAEGEEAMFGGQIKIKENFKNVHIEGVELSEMGQHFTSDAFPVFFDKALNVTDEKYTEPAYVTDNSIVNSFRGCVALRATHGLYVAKNVAYRHKSNCIFLMEGGEKHNHIEGNLAIGTMEPESDNDALMKIETKKTASFFITNPLTHFVNNVAGGGEDAGIVFYFPPEPLGQSKSMGLMQRDEAFHTPLVEFSGNVAHSYQEAGIDLSSSITDDQDLYYNSMYEPKTDPLNPNDSEDVEVFMTNITSYKNSYYNLNSRGGFYHYQQCSFSDSGRGVLLSMSSDQRQYLTDTVILGESPNIGEPLLFWDNVDRVWDSMPRSIPFYWNRNYPMKGISLLDGPHYFHNIWFNHFVSNTNYTVAAIGFYDGNKWRSSPQTSFQQMSWGFDDGAATGNRVWDDAIGDVAEKTGEKQVIFRDLDGSVTGLVDSTVVKPYPMLYTDNCSLRENWNMYACPHRYAKVQIYNHNSDDRNSITPVMTRDDLPGQPFYQNWKTSAYFPVVIGQDYSYILRFESKMPLKVTLVAHGVEKDLWVRIGVCLPKDADIDLYTYSPDWKPRIENWNQVDNLTSLEEADIATSYFWDTDNGFVFFKFKNDLPRNNTYPYEKFECPDDKCPMARITVKNADAINLDLSDCKARAYEGDSPYKRTRIVSVDNSAASVTSLSATSPEPSDDMGAGVSYPFNGMHVSLDEGYGEWSSWTECTALCGGGIQERERSCQDNTGCAGPSFQDVNCNTFACSADHNSNTTAWSTWSECPVSCGEGTQVRTRTCKEGRVCSDALEDTRQCNTESCAVDGNWGSWAAWSGCSATCGGGQRTRQRACDNPVPSSGGQDCPGDSQEMEACSTQECPIDGGYETWGSWSSCSKSCGGGTRSRSRSCNSPAPQHGGLECQDTGEEAENCNQESCDLMCETQPPAN